MTLSTREAQEAGRRWRESQPGMVMLRLFLIGVQLAFWALVAWAVWRVGMWAQCA